MKSYSCIYSIFMKLWQETFLSVSTVRVGKQNTLCFRIYFNSLASIFYLFFTASLPRNSLILLPIPEVVTIRRAHWIYMSKRHTIQIASTMGSELPITCIQWPTADNVLLSAFPPIHNGPEDFINAHHLIFLDRTSVFNQNRNFTFIYQGASSF